MTNKSVHDKEELHAAPPWPVSEEPVKQRQSYWSIWPMTFRARKYKRAPAEYVTNFCCLQAPSVWSTCERPRQVSIVENVCLHAWGFWHLRTHTIYASCVLVRSLRIQCSRALNALFLSVKDPMRSSIRVCPSSREMSDKHYILWFASHCCQGTAKTRIAGFAGLRCSFRVIGSHDSAWVQQRLRECMPLCLDSNTRGHVLLSRLSRRRARVFRVTRSFCDESRSLGSACVCSYSRGMRAKVFVSRGPVPKWAIRFQCQSHFSPEPVRSWAELYSAWPCLSTMHVIVCGEPR